MMLTAYHALHNLQPELLPRCAVQFHQLTPNTDPNLPSELNVPEFSDATSNDYRLMPKS